LKSSHDQAKGGHKLEMFARERREGFEPWGAEVDFFSAWKEPR
jgi:N6-adenosine-specific RNA methylase IME4